MSAVSRRGAVVVLAAAFMLLGARTAHAVAMCPDQFAVAAGSSSYELPYCTNKSLSTRDDSVQRLVVVVHGTERNAADYERFMVAAANSAGATDALVVAPQFLTAGDGGGSASTLRWTDSGWKDGGESQSSPSVSSFAAVDQLIARIADGTTFPSLREVVVAGHSAGGQFTMRYALANHLDGTLRVPMRYVVANPSSYAYLTAERPVGGTDDQFAVPSSKSCSGYDDYKYGMNVLAPYLAATGPAALRAQFQARHVTYLLGANDTSPHDSSLDTTCPAELQGAYRLARGTAYVHYLGHLYGPGVYDTQRRVVVPGVGHDGNAMFNSSEGRAVLFAALPEPQPAPAPAPGPAVGTPAATPVASQPARPPAPKRHRARSRRCRATRHAHRKRRCVARRHRRARRHHAVR